MCFPVSFPQGKVSSSLSQFPVAKSISLSFAKRSVLAFMLEFQSADGDSANRNQLNQLSFACGIALRGYLAHRDLGRQKCKLH